MRNLTAIMLLILLWAPIIGSLAVLQYQRLEHRRIVKWQILKQLDRQDLTLLRLSHHEAAKVLHWSEAHEFEYMGRWYDVVERRETRDSIILLCWEDHAETALNRKIERAIALTTGQTPLQRQTQEHLLHFLKSLYCLIRPLPETDFILLPEPAEFPSTAMHYTSTSYGPPPPPPWAG